MAQQNFIDTQLGYSRVQEAKSLYDESLKQLFLEKKISFPSKNIYIRVFKQEQLLEVWATENSQFILIKTYPFTANSGILGPKQKEGDLQIPEGFYQLEYFNPQSNFHLSFKINYPNAADSIRNKKTKNLGNDIFIHGDVKTIGCIPIGDNNISELYWLCVNTFSINNFIPIHIFPFKMENEKCELFYNKYATQTTFWKSIKPMYQFFQSHKILGDVTGCDKNGNYQLAIP